MKLEFTKEYMLSNRGCYSREKMLDVKCVAKSSVTLENLFNELPIKDFCWFLVKKCDLTILEKQKFALHCAKQVVPIYEEYYPEDKRVSDCVEATIEFLEDNLSIEELRLKRIAAYAAYDATAYAAYASYAAYAAYATADAAVDADYAAYAAYAAVDAAATAAYASYATDAYKESIWEFVETLTQLKHNRVKQFN